MAMIPEQVLKAEDIHQVSMKTLHQHLKLNIDGYRCDTDMVFNALLKAAADNSSIEAACADLLEVADSNTLREQLNAALDVADLWRHEVELNNALADGIPDNVGRNGVELAIDFHDEPFYGQTPELRTYVSRDQAKKGTTRFFRIASAYVMWRGIRLTLALTYVLPEYSTLDVLRRLLQRLGHLNFQAKVLYLDKGFCSGDVINYLQDHQQPTIIACAIRGKSGGTRALCQGRKSYRITYTFTDGTCVDMAVVATLPPGKSGKRRRKWLLFVVIGLDWSPRKVKRTYRRRFGIECSYRHMRQVRIITNSRNPAVKFFVLGLALVLVNLWQRLRWVFFRRPGRGPATIMPQYFRFRRFISLLLRAVENAYGVIMGIPTHISPQSVIY